MTDKKPFIAVFLAVSATAACLSPALSERPFIAWYVGGKYIDEDFYIAAEKYRPDAVILTVFAEDDIIPMNGKEFDLNGLVQRMHSLGIEVYFSFSLFSRSSKGYDDYQADLERGISYEEQAIHLADYAEKVMAESPESFGDIFSSYIKYGLNPREIPHAVRKPVDGYYVEPGVYTSINPLYEPYQRFLAGVIGETLQKAEPDGLAFDHIRFFTFDSDFSNLSAEFALENCRIDFNDYTPAPLFAASAEDMVYYDCRAQMVQAGTDSVVSSFNFPKWGTTMGMTEAARANGQYVELQGQAFDALLLMEYGSDPVKTGENVKETKERCGCGVILGIPPFINGTAKMLNVRAGLENGADGIYLLGYEDFGEEFMEYLHFDARKRISRVFDVFVKDNILSASAGIQSIYLSKTKP